MSSLALTLLYLLAAVLGVVTCRSLKLPPMLGYLAAGVLIGPHALALAQNSEGVRANQDARAQVTQHGRQLEAATGHHAQHRGQQVKQCQGE